MEYFVGDIIAYPMIKDAVFLVKEITPDTSGSDKILLCSKKGEKGIAQIHASNRNITLKWRLPKNRAGENL
tara:strand:+ start:115 stop:327 length:213 start_codon:yes stop_codon:yes gene_type:complete